MDTKRLSTIECFHYHLQIPLKDLEYLFLSIEHQGFVSSTDVHQLVSYGIPIFSLADHFGCSVKDFIKKCSNNEIKSNDFLNAINQMTSPEGMFYMEEEPKSVQIDKAFRNLKLAIKNLFKIN